MIDIKNVFPECDADTLLIGLIKEKGFPNHQHGISSVNNALRTREDSNSILIGIVDLDRAKNIEENKHLIKFTEEIANTIGSDEELLLKKLPSKEHYVIFVNRAFESWIWKQADLAGINKNTFGFTSLDDLCDVSKHYRTTADSDNGKKFKKFVNTVVRANPPGIILLRKWLVDNTFE